MFTRKQRGERSFVPVTPEFHERKKRNNWYTIGTAIILISIVIAIMIGMWSGTK